MLILFHFITGSKQYFVFLLPNSYFILVGIGQTPCSFKHYWYLVSNDVRITSPLHSDIWNKFPIFSKMGYQEGWFVSKIKKWSKFVKVMQRKLQRLFLYML